jgi:uncharacterized SAM-binding protein YcdF (DUF218 family)
MRRLAPWILLGLSCLLVVAAAAVILGVGRWLVVEDPLEKAQAIAVLNGRMPVRAIEAARIYQAGYAQEIWLTRTTEPGASLEAIDIPYVGEDFYNRRVLIHEGVPADAIRVLESSIDNTADEVEAIAAALQQENDRTVILVTTKAHTRRVRALCAGSQGRGAA